MTDANDIDRILSPWLYENGTTPPPRPAATVTPYETRLQSTGPSDGGTVSLTPETMYASAGRLAQIRTEVETDGNTAINSTDNTAIGANLQITKAVGYIHDRWQKKLAHVLEDMQERVDRVRKAADNWQETEKDIKKTFDN